jgi:hypothetical protein
VRTASPVAGQVMRVQHELGHCAFGVECNWRVVDEAPTAMTTTAS